jgi:cold shock protein
VANLAPAGPLAGAFHYGGHCYNTARAGPALASQRSLEGGFGCPSVFGVIICSAVEAKSIGADMSKGTVKWFNSQKGYGFIQPQGGGKDVFVHISAVERAGLSGLNEGQIVEYEEVSNKGKTSAEHLRVQR